MSTDTKANLALAHIRAILDDDINYQTAVLKLGGIWAACDYAAQYVRGVDHIQVIEK